MLAALAMYAHGQRGSSQQAKYGKGRYAPSQTIGQDSVSCDGYSDKRACMEPVDALYFM